MYLIQCELVIYFRLVSPSIKKCPYGKIELNIDLNIYVSAMCADAMARCVVRSLAVIVLTVNMSTSNAMSFHGSLTWAFID